MRALSVIVLAACSSTEAAGPQPVSVKLADVGLEAGSLDRTADPCIDFYQHTCGGWLAANKIPDEKARWGRFAEIDERNKAAIRALLDDAIRGGSDASAKKLGDYYASCMD